MKTVHDYSVSKRAMQVPEPEDIEQLYMKKDVLQADIDLIEAQVDKLKGSSDYKFIVDRSKEREMELLLAIACTDPRESIKIATMQGQLAERKKLTEEILSLQDEIKIKRTVLERFNDTIRKWSERMIRWQEKEGV